MKNTGTGISEGYVNAVFAGHNDKEIRVKIIEENSYGTYRLALYNPLAGIIESSDSPKNSIDLTKFSKETLNKGLYVVVIIYEKDGKQFVSCLRNMRLTVPAEAKSRIYDRRCLYGKEKNYGDSSFFLPCYTVNQTLAIEIHSEAGSLFEGQLVNEVVLAEEFEKDGTDGIRFFVKSKKVNGNYIGLCDEEGHITEYTKLEEDDNFVYMSFFVSKAEFKGFDKYKTVWTHNQVLYRAAIDSRKEFECAHITGFKAAKDEVTLFLWYDKKYGEDFTEAYLCHNAGTWEQKCDLVLSTEEKEIKEDGVYVTVSFKPGDKLKNIGTWDLLIRINKDGEETVLPVDANSGVRYGNFLNSEGTKYAFAFVSNAGRLQVEKKYGHNALFKKNIQPSPVNCTLDEFLETAGMNLKGDIYGEFVQKDNGKAAIRIYQNINSLIEARLVMVHVMWMGILSVQDVKIENGEIGEIEVECPDIDSDGKFDKPVPSVWFRIALAIRTSQGIYYCRMVNYDLKAEENTNLIYDKRNLYLDPSEKKVICGVEMTSLPYYGDNKMLSMKFVRNNQIYRSQFTNELLNVTIKKDILTVVMRCRDCGVEYKGVVMEYRKVKEDDDETFLVPYESLVKKRGWYIMTTRIDMKKHYMRMLYWDIRCAFEENGEIQTVSCHSNNMRFLKKYKNVFVDRTYPNENSIMFPYGTDNRSVALMHRETCPQDHWQFRLKEKVAMFLYRQFKDHWDSKNIYLIFEKYCTMAQDNGFYFFKYCMDANVERKFDGHIYYVIDPKQNDWNNVVLYKKHVLKYLSLKHMIYLQACKLMISTDTKGHAYVWRSMGSEIKAMTYRKNLVFLQHGVTAFKRGHFERGTNVGCESFITTSKFEQNIISTYLGYPVEEVPVTGFARWDVLKDKSEGHREILMMPTWRTWLDDAENEIFAQSDYCRNYMALLNNPGLDELLKKYDVTLNFYLHPKFRKFITEFSVVSDHIRLIPFGEEPLNELMMECNLLITDFSSVAWDVYYMNKPVVFYHFDIEEASKTLGFYMDMKNDLFGDRAETPDELMSLIKENIENGFAMKEKYSRERKKYFAYIDDNNSERIWQAIQDREWIDNCE